MNLLYAIFILRPASLNYNLGHWQLFVLGAFLDRVALEALVLENDIDLAGVVRILNMLAVTENNNLFTHTDNTAADIEPTIVGQTTFHFYFSKVTNR